MTPEARLARLCEAVWGSAWPVEASKRTSLNIRSLERCRAAERDGMPCHLADGCLEGVKYFLRQVIKESEL